MTWTGKVLLRVLRRLGCTELRQKGSHVVPIHASEDLGPGLLRAIERDLEPCLGRASLRRHEG